MLTVSNELHLYSDNRPPNIETNSISGRFFGWISGLAGNRGCWQHVGYRNQLFQVSTTGGRLSGSKCTYFLTKTILKWTINDNSNVYNTDEQDDQAPTYGPAPLPVYPDTPPAYDFAYGVQGDAINGNAQYAHSENRNGYTTNGEYRVALPDGRTQVVSYNVLDAASGYVADVKYEGQPIAYAAPRPAYGPAY